MAAAIPALIQANQAANQAQQQKQGAANTAAGIDISPFLIGEDSIFGAGKGQEGGVSNFGSAPSPVQAPAQGGNFSSLQPAPFNPGATAQQQFAAPSQAGASLGSPSQPQLPTLLGFDFRNQRGI